MWTACLCTLCEVLFLQLVWLIAYQLRCFHTRLLPFHMCRPPKHHALTINYVKKKLAKKSAASTSAMSTLEQDILVKEKCRRIGAVTPRQQQQLMMRRRRRVALMQLWLGGHTWCITRLLHKNPRSETLAWSRDRLLSCHAAAPPMGEGGRGEKSQGHTRWKKAQRQVCLQSLSLPHRSVLSQKYVHRRGWSRTLPQNSHPGRLD